MGYVSRFFKSLGFGSYDSEINYPSNPSIDGGIVSLSQYWQERNITYQDEWTYEVQQNASELLRRVNSLLVELKVASVKVTSGWRPKAVNQKIGGSARSYHITGQAVDLRDNDAQELSKLIIKNNHLLHRQQLWLEDPARTRGNTNWVHLDIGTRPDQELRVFKP